MNLGKSLTRMRAVPSALAMIAACGLLKLAAFAREAFIAANFGLSGLTDAYFAFQQLPLILAAFMFGAFSLAFTPAYAAEKRASGSVAWLPALLVYGGVAGALLTVLTIACAPWISRMLHAAPASHAFVLLAILSCSFPAIVWLGIWAGTAIADGNSLLAMLVTALPYLVMTVFLVVGGFAGLLNDLSLPVSFLIGFVGVGVWALSALLAQRNSVAGLRGWRHAWSMPAFRGFLAQLGASFGENAGYSANQLLLVFFVAQTGPGALSANAYAMRVGMIGFSLLGQPFAQLMQARLCAAGDARRPAVFRRGLAAVAGAVFVFAAILLAVRVPLVGAIYFHGKVSARELSSVIEMVAPWAGYFVVTSLNAIVARYLFTMRQGKRYVRRQLWAYAVANLIRLVCWGKLSAPALVWCSVLLEACALLVNLRDSVREREDAGIQPGLLNAVEA